MANDNTPPPAQVQSPEQQRPQQIINPIPDVALDKDMPATLGIFEGASGEETSND